MDNRLSIGYSTCPNDTFIFYGLAHDLIDCKGIKFDVTLDDVETLNQIAKTGELDVSKLSFAALGHLQDTYGLLRSGAAIGRGCGPLVIARPGCDLKELLSKKVAVPGVLTTASLLLGLYVSGIPATVPIPFDQIMPAVQKGAFDFGVIIHEGRFTYGEHGLVSLVDLGKWWEEETSLPIPLGGIAVHRRIDSVTAKNMDDAIRKSVLYASENPDLADKYIMKYAQEMSRSVVRQHIDLYVNDFTLDMGEEGANAVNRLFGLSREKGIIPCSSLPLFAY